jgi:lipopolysaccharide biosynthesis regulator YciM
MRRNLASELNDKFDSIVSPLLKGETSYSSREECQFVAVELDSCLSLLEEQHYMYSNIKARKLYMDAMSLTWALTESEYNIGLKPNIEKAIDLLEQSEKLEPHASYTLSALGTRYFYVYEYTKAFEKFQKFVDLRPKDFYARYSLAKIFIKLNEFEKAEALLLELINSHPRDEFLYSLLCDAYFNDNKKTESLDWARKLTEVANDKTHGYFQIAVYYTLTKNIDSAKYYYELCKKKQQSNSVYDNNIAYGYLMKNNLDSALYYFTKANKSDTTDPFPIFNLGTIDVIKENYYPAIEKFVKTIQYSNSFADVAIPEFEIYFNKHYNITDSGQYNEFKNKTYIFNLQYASFLSIFYCYLRDFLLFNLNDKIELIFSTMKNYKEYDVYTYYHYACYKALQKNKDAALDNIKKSLELGFGNYFMLTSDADLDYIRNTPEFINLLKQYFPDKMK